MLTAVFLDLMDTVITDPYVAALEAATGLPLHELHGVKDPQSWPDFEMGLIDEAEFVRRFWAVGEDGRPFDIAAFHAARRRGYAFVPGMDAVLDELAGRARRYAATNYPVWVEELTETFGLASRFEGVYASCHFGVRKPDPRFFQSLLEVTGHPASESLFVDDRARNCAAAAEAGMKAHLFTDVAEFRDRLAAEGLLDGSAAGTP